MKRIIKILVLTTLIIVLFVCNAFAETINIPSDYATIQAGINAAIDGDIVLVQPGIYIENINYNGKNITVASLFLTTQDTSYISQTIIDGDSVDSVIKFESGEDSTAVLTGFTITNGNNVEGGGGGICCLLNSSPSLLNVKITGNRANYGAGIFCAIDSSPSLQNVTIKDNDACLGGGIYCYHSSPSLQNVTITGNSATYGGGICCDESSPSLDNVTLTDNSAAWSGGGIYCGSSDLSLENLTKTDNRTVWNDGRIISYESSPSIVNSIVSDNTGDFGIYVNSGNPIINYSDFYNNEGGNFYGVNDSIGVNVTTNTNGDSCDVFYNIQLEPLFVDPLNGDYHLSWVNFPTPDSTMSPCIDAGDPSSPLDPDGTIADMGAYYFNQDVSIDEPGQPTEFNLTNYPNPISSHINDLAVSFSIHEPGKVKIQLFNIKGQLVSTLINEDKNIGDYTICHSVNNLSSGIYFTKMSIDGVDREIRKVILLR